MNSAMGGTSGVEVTLPPVPLLNDKDEENKENIDTIDRLKEELKKLQENLKE